MQKTKTREGWRFYQDGTLLTVFKNSSDEYEYTVYNATSINDPEPVEIDGGIYGDYANEYELAFDVLDEYKDHKLY